jgi:hypothetical protein
MNSGTKLNGYKAFYNGKTTDVYAHTALVARDKAVEYFKAPKSKAHLVTVVLAETDVDHKGKGTPYVHTPDF